MKYLVTGGAGFIGSHIVEYLVNQGHQVRVLDNLSSGKIQNLSSVINQIEFIEGDIRDQEACEKACRGMDYVFHEAALGSVPLSIDDPITNNDVNIRGTLNVLLAAKTGQVKRVVYASSSAVYGDSPKLPKIEDMAIEPLSPYALSKYAGEAYMKLFSDLYGLETVSLRYFNVFGPRQDPNSHYAAVIPKFVSLLVQEKSPVIFGDGEQTRDFAYVADVVHANMLAMSSDKKACGKTYNIACNKKITINDLFKTIREFVAEQKPQAKNINPIYEAPRLGDIRDSRADISLAQSLLNFEPRIEVRDGLSKTVASFLK